MQHTSPRKFSSLVLSGLLLALSGNVASAQTQTYPGNGGTSFGGPIGNGMLTITSNGANLDFSLTTGATFNSNALVLYVDSAAGGVGSTASFTDEADNSRIALSGFNNAAGNPTGADTRTLANFPAGFTANFGITLEPASGPGFFSGTYDLSTPANFTFLNNNGLAGGGTAFTFSVPKTTLGLPAAGDFSLQFVGSLISTTAFRSNETFGSSTSDNADGFNNPGFNGTTTFNAANTFAVPEPGTVAFFSVGAALLAGMGWRRSAARQG